MSTIFRGSSSGEVHSPSHSPLPHGHRAGEAGGGGGGGGFNERGLESLLAETAELMDRLRAAEALRRSEPPSLFKLQPVRLRQWRIRRQDSQITATFDSLFPRLVRAVEETTILASEVDEKTIALRDQAYALKVRLNACICYNTEYLANKSGLVEEMRRVVDMLSAYSTEIKSMITFNVEVIRQRLVQSVSQGRSFVSWGNRAMLMRPISETELGEDADHSFLMAKLRFVRESKEDLMVKLTDLLELREMHTLNLEAGTVAYTDVCDLIESVNDSMGQKQKQKPGSPGRYDHSTCPDCSIINTMSEQCIDHLSSLIRQQEDVKVWCDALKVAKAKVEEAKVEINRFYDVENGGAVPVPEASSPRSKSQEKGAGAGAGAHGTAHSREGGAASTTSTASTGSAGSGAAAVGSDNGTGTSSSTDVDDSNSTKGSSISYTPNVEELVLVSSH
jgi:hypothetical protein